MKKRYNALVIHDKKVRKLYMLDNKEEWKDRFVWAFGYAPDDTQLIGFTARYQEETK